MFTLSISTHVHKSVSTLHDSGLRDTDLTKAFRRMLRTKLHERQKDDITWPLTPEERLSRLDTGRLREIHDAKYFLIYQSRSTNQYRYATTSHIKTTKM